MAASLPDVLPGPKEVSSPGPIAPMMGTDMGQPGACPRPSKATVAAARLYGVDPWERVPGRKQGAITVPRVSAILSPQSQEPCLPLATVTLQHPVTSIPRDVWTAQLAQHHPLGTHRTCCTSQSA